MQYVIEGTPLTPIQADTYDTVMRMHYETCGLNIALQKAEKELGKVHKFTCSLRITLNELNRKYQDELDRLYEQGGDYTHLIKL